MLRFISIFQRSSNSSNPRDPRNMSERIATTMALFRCTQKHKLLTCNFFQPKVHSNETTRTAYTLRIVCIGGGPENVTIRVRRELLALCLNNHANHDQRRT